MLSDGIGRELVFAGRKVPEEAMSYKNVILNDEQLNDINKYRKSFGDNWAEGSIDWKKADIYIETNFNKVKEVNSKPFRCCDAGVYTFVRKDGQGVNIDDLEAFNRRDYGQKNTIIGKPGDKQIIQDWLCDSGD